jgi:hypothetical protein
VTKKEFIQHLRVNRIIKGNRPAFVTLRKSFGNIYKGKKSDFIMSITTKELFFQKVTMFKGLKPELDFSLKISDLKHFNITSYQGVFNTLCLYDHNRNFLEINFDGVTQEARENAINIDDIIKRLAEAGVTELPNEEENNEESDD